MGVFSDAAAGLPLSPAQRAFLRFVEGLLMTALVAALPVFSQLLAGQNLAQLNWAATAQSAAGAFGVALLLTLSKYFKAHGDLPGAAAGQLLDTAAADLQKTAGLPNDVKIEPAPIGPPLDVPGGTSGAPAAVTLND
jgi:hypothetical protein